jgi:hypothetical protein
VNVGVEGTYNGGFPSIVSKDLVPFSNFTHGLLSMGEKRDKTGPVDAVRVGRGVISEGVWGGGVVRVEVICAGHTCVIVFVG